MYFCKAGVMAKEANKLTGKQIGIALSTAGVAEAYTEEV